MWIGLGSMSIIAILVTSLLMLVKLVVGMMSGIRTEGEGTGGLALGFQLDGWELMPPNGGAASAAAWKLPFPKLIPNAGACAWHSLRGLEAALYAETRAWLCLEKTEHAGTA